MGDTGEMSDKICPKCGTELTTGNGHGTGMSFQYIACDECHEFLEFSYYPKQLSTKRIDEIKNFIWYMLRSKSYE